MGFEFVGIEEAIEGKGLRMMVVGGVPSPWGEAAKGIFHIKGIPWQAVRLDYASEPQAKWARRRSGPVVVVDDEAPRHGWAEILLLAERLAPAPTLLPEDPALRATVFGLAHEICGEAGLCWSRRLQLVHGGAADGQGRHGFPEPVAQYLGNKYGYRPAEGAGYGQRVAQLLGLFASRLKAQQAMGREFLVGEAMTAVDVYLATAMALFAPLPAEQCAMNGSIRAAFETLDDTVRPALDPVLLQHRDLMYDRYLERPLCL